MLADELDYVVGVDPHRDAHALAVVDPRSGVLVFEASIAATARVTRLAPWPSRIGARLQKRDTAVRVRPVSSKKHVSCRKQKQMTTLEIVEQGTILRATVGSTVHGLHHGGQDDREEMAVFIELPEYPLGPIWRGFVLGRGWSGR
jgi:hypothetical protein